MNLNEWICPNYPEIYLNESFCNVNHVEGSTWLLKNSSHYTTSGKGQRYCIVGAGAVYTKNGKLHAEWVPESLEFWPSPYKANDADYHDNFNGGLFNQWLERLCAALLLVYGPCRIHLDGASPHKIQFNAPPPSNARRAELIEWLQGQGFTVPSNYSTQESNCVLFLHRCYFVPFY
ncbi:putative DDE superfamily endonuclease domain-containing protein [Phytophthora infestans]|uniref:Putative DDE superfamily endonuclease domain-containing protein n=1 Tax=Phytophthora infestans TaxID=4787 RepID=A0A8S9UWL1_PHYIN|nr:putative DDE superfamily endonuclease domain-containing protein [Phytophthora infestans]